MLICCRNSKVSVYISDKTSQLLQEQHFPIGSLKHCSLEKEMSHRCEKISCLVQYQHIFGQYWKVKVCGMADGGCVPFGLTIRNCYTS